MAKLTDWAKEPSLQDLKGDLEQAKPSHDAHVSRVNDWNDMLAVRGKYKPKTVKGRSSIQPKLVRRQAEWRYSALSEPFLGTDKMFNVHPSTYADVQAAEQNEMVLNWQFRTKLNKVKFIDSYVRATVDDGTCVVRLGWERQIVELPTEIPVFSYYQITDPQQMQGLQQVVDLKQSNPRQYDQLDDATKAGAEYSMANGVAVYAQQTGTTTQKVPTLLCNRPTLEILNLANVYIDPSCNGDFDKAMFVVVSFETCKADLMKDPKQYKNLNFIDWESNSPLAQPDHVTSTPDSFQFKDSARKKVVAYEYWGYYDVDGSGTLTPFVATWIGNVMIRMEENPFPDQKLPFVVVPYLPIKRELMGEPDAELLGDNQAILGATTRGMIDIMGRSANGQQGFAKGMLDPLNKRRYEQGQDYEYNPQQGNPQQSLITHTFPEIPNSAVTMVQLQNEEAEALTGVKSFSGGISGQAYGDVAANARNALDAASKREMAILRRLAQGMQEIGYKIISMNAEWLSEEETIRVTNEDFVKVSREDLRGNFELIVDISTAEIDDQKSQDLAFLLQTIGPNADWGFRQIILVQMAKLKRMPDLAQALQNYQPQPDPIAVQKAQLEIKELESVIQKNEAQTNLFEAQAAMAGANKDKVNLDFIEQESGVSHARDMEKIQSQAEANQNLEVTKAILKPTKQANGGETKPNIPAAVGFNQMSHTLNGSGNIQTGPQG